MDSADLLADRARVVDWTFDNVPPGSYLLEYNLYFDKSDVRSDRIFCSMSFTNADHIEPTLALSSSSTHTVTGSAFIAFGAAGRQPQLGCGTTSGTIRIGEPKRVQSSITMTEVDQVREIEVTTRTLRQH